MKWSTEQVNYLINAYPQNVPIEILAKRLGKQPCAVSAKANRLGLRRSTEVLPEGLKRCPDCKEIKNLDTDYHSTQSVCKDCHRIRRNEWGKRNREYLRKYGTRRRHAKGLTKTIRKWEDDEIAYMRTHYTTKDTYKISIALKRSRRSINAMAMRLGLDKRNVSTRFWSKVNKTDGCWEWTARRDKDGYGQFRLNGKNPRAHRVAWELTNGAIPDDLFACHKCDNPSCVRPDHLFLGTADDNNKDMMAKSRNRSGTHRGK